jgi:acyl-CoA synthetase (AMP-forming)/AMP-acid ligase II
MNVVELIRGHAARHPTDVALIDVYDGKPRETTFRDLEQKAGRTATLLQQAGLRRGDLVLVFHAMSAELYVALAALWRLGLVAMFVDPSAGRLHIDRCCTQHRPRGMIASGKAHWLRLVSRELRRIPYKFSIGLQVPGAAALEAAEECGYDPCIEACRGDEAALISFTSGSTGDAKQAVRTHDFLLAQHRAIAGNLGLAAGDIELVALPIFVLANLASRVTSVIPNCNLRRPDAIDAAPLVAQIQRHRVARATAPPALYERLAEFCEERQIVLPGLRNVLTGGGPVSLRLMQRLQQLAPQAEVTAVYGSSEAEPICRISLHEMRPNDFLDVREGNGLLAGRPVPDIQLRIVEDQWGKKLAPRGANDFDRMCRPVGTAGEIVVSGEHVLNGYADSLADDENKFCVGPTRWHRMGDAGYMDALGRLWLVGRCAARVVDRHGALYPFGVETAALRFDFVRRTALVSLREKRVLAVELRRRAARADLDRLVESLAFARVDAVRVIKRLPVDRRHNTKVDYAVLREMLS